MTAYYFSDLKSEGSCEAFLKNGEGLVAVIFLGYDSGLTCKDDMPEGSLCIELEEERDFRGQKYARVQGGERVYLDPRTGTGQSMDEVQVAMRTVYNPHLA